jgi:hypothetical protein
MRERHQRHERPSDPDLPAVGPGLTTLRDAAQTGLPGLSLTKRGNSLAIRGRHSSCRGQNRRDQLVLDMTRLCRELRTTKQFSLR